jgi:hypothetical protein
MSKREEILDTAKAYISGPRATDYGTPEENFGKIARLWEQQFGWEVDAHDVALAMILVKTARLSHRADSFDGWTDIAGYAALGGEIVVGD